MTRKELTSEIRSQASRSRRRILVGATIIGLWMISGAFLDNFLNWEGSEFLRKAYGVSGFIVVVVFLLVLAASPCAGVPCPNCKKRLFGITAQIAVATGNCGYCGDKVFE